MIIPKSIGVDPGKILSKIKSPNFKIELGCKHKKTRTFPKEMIKCVGCSESFFLSKE